MAEQRKALRATLTMHFDGEELRRNIERMVAEGRAGCVRTDEGDAVWFTGGPPEVPLIRVTPTEDG